MQFMAPRYMRGAFFAYFCRVLRIGKKFFRKVLLPQYCAPVVAIFVRLASFRLLVM